MSHESEESRKYESQAVEELIRCTVSGNGLHRLMAMKLDPIQVADWE